MEVKVAICCQVLLLGEGICKLLEENDEIHILGVSSTNSEIEELLDRDPDVIVTDIGNCQKIINLLPRENRKNVLLLDDVGRYLDSNDLKLMITDGLGGLLSQNSDSDALKKAIKKINEGELWFDRQTLRQVLSGSTEENLKVHLTRKETQILECICKGLTNKEIAKKMYISEQTVKSHCNHLFKKFGVSSRLKLAVHAPKYFSHEMHVH
jgi:DNA-binding NarL/FixJ family response regulator